MATLGADPIELSLAHVISSEEPVIDLGEVSVPHPRGLVRPPIESVRLIDDEQVEGFL
jgi:hypothetical protein